MRLRKLVIATHRDLGYLFAGLTVMYAVSGVAVNHIEDWNPNYVLRSETVEIGDVQPAARDEMAAEVLRRMSITEVPNSVILMSPTELKVFLEQRTLTVTVPEGAVVDERFGRRFAFFEVNFLHLNHGKGLWTWYADVYAVALLVLASTGIFIIPGRKGLGGRGRWLLVAGMVVPVAYLVWKL